MDIFFFLRFNFPAQMSVRPDHTPDRPDYITQLRALPKQGINVRFFEHIIEDHATPGPRFRQEMPLQNFGDFYRLLFISRGGWYPLSIASC